MKSQYQIGAGKSQIEITTDMFPYGFGRGMKFTGIHDPLYVRTIIVENNETRIVLIGMDLDSMGHIDFWKNKIQSVIKVPRDNIYIMATHNHESIHIRNDKDDAPEGDADTQRSESLVWTAMERALHEAEGQIQPGRISFGTGFCDININREYKYHGGYMIGRNPHGSSDKTVAVFRFENMEGDPIALFMNYAVHGSVMAEMEGVGELLITSDLPGCTSRIVEQHYGHPVVAIWTSGAAGNQDAKYRATRIMPNEDGNLYYGNYGAAGYALIDMQARDLAEEVIRISETMEKADAEGELSSKQTVCEVAGKDHGRGPYDSSPHGMSAFGAMHGPRPVEPEENPYAPRDLETELESTIPIQIGLLRIGETVLSCCSGEETWELGQMAKRALKEFFRDVVIVTHCNGYIGYLADSTGFDRRVRSALVSLVARGYAEKAVVTTPVKLAKEIATVDIL